MTIYRDPFPLQWPEHTKRTSPDARMRSHFGARASGQVSIYQAACEVVGELRRMGATTFAITSNLPTRNDGLPYADGGRRQIDPGIAVWFVSLGNERVFACDRWASAGENLRAIAKTIEAFRGLDRWGVAEVMERAFRGFTALPAAGETAEGVPPPPAKRPWREVLGGTWPELEPAELLIIAKSRHRAAIKSAHPDAGGAHDAAAALNVALAEAEQELAR